MYGAGLNYWMERLPLSQALGWESLWGQGPLCAGFSAVANLHFWVKLTMWTLCLSNVLAVRQAGWRKKVKWFPDSNQTVLSNISRVFAWTREGCSQHNTLQDYNPDCSHPQMMCFFHKLQLAKNYKKNNNHIDMKKEQNLCKNLKMKPVY